MPNLNSVSQVNKPALTACNMDSTNAIVNEAYNRICSQRNNYAKASTPTSPYGNLTGNTIPNKTKILWLKGINKCNQFVGDVLVASGYAMPTNLMENKTEHYKAAEALPSQKDYFYKVGDTDIIQPGDLYVIDYGRRSGESGAHIEIILGYNQSKNTLTLAGAHKDGAYETTINFNVKALRYDKFKRCWTNGTNQIFILRPKKRIINR